MRRLRFTLLGDGSSDEALIRHLDWLIRRHVANDVAVESNWADLRGLLNRPTSLKARLVAALDYFPCDLLFVHRDAEKEDPEKRIREIKAAWNEAACSVEYVPVIPVRMSEAWLLTEEMAIRKAAGNPNGTDCLDLPQLKEIEGLPDPKKILQQALRRASGLSGRRLKAFQPRPRRVAEYMEDFRTLRALPAFSRLESSLQKSLAVLGLSALRTPPKGQQASE